MGTFPQGDEELRTIGIGTSIRHAEQGFRVQRPGEVFVREHASVYRFAAGAIALGEVCWIVRYANFRWRDITRLLLGS